MLVAPAGSDTFPLDDADGLFVTKRLRVRRRTHASRRDRALRCVPAAPRRGQSTPKHTTSSSARSSRRSSVRRRPSCTRLPSMRRSLAPSRARRALVVWSPRSNLSLYGNTAPVRLLRRSGVEIALGTDWLLSGSMNVRRELECARSFSERYLDGELDAPALLRMATASAARAAGAGRALGRIAPGLLRRSAGRATTGARAARGRRRRRRRATCALVLRAGVPLYGDAATARCARGRRLRSARRVRRPEARLPRGNGTHARRARRRVAVSALRLRHAAERAELRAGATGRIRRHPERQRRDGDGVAERRSTAARASSIPRVHSTRDARRTPTTTASAMRATRVRSTPRASACASSLRRPRRRRRGKRRRRLPARAGSGAARQRCRRYRGRVRLLRVAEPRRLPLPARGCGPARSDAPRAPAAPRARPRRDASVVAVRPDAGGARGYYARARERAVFRDLRVHGECCRPVFRSAIGVTLAGGSTPTRERTSSSPRRSSNERPAARHRAHSSSRRRAWATTARSPSVTNRCSCESRTSPLRTQTPTRRPTTTSSCSTGALRIDDLLEPALDNDSRRGHAPALRHGHSRSFVRALEALAAQARRLDPRIG